ncbi:fructosamine kinase family protein [Wenzhouxiangella sp. XN79A]|uniref:fructosamine kinase family protein n=1 Tax=Wenzhouxiangella sp. XN79A TaxID=2724193 RepID=UPI00144A9224|nr:fructosamine kinase family protein [Wenzhouxiangella sp. XN79A]NKI36190.1 fructosamine kinase family protein [Wenzhouxiangella sp. XN79A]
MRTEQTETLARALGLPANAVRLRPLGGAGATSTFRLDGPDGARFVKGARREFDDPLVSEADGLQRLAEPACLRIPRFHDLLETGGETWLVLEWLDLRPLTTAAARSLGRTLAEHHRSAVAERHGLERDNRIGATPQVNTPTEDWTEFLFRHRIGALIERLAEAGTGFDPGTTDRLREAWQRDFADHRPVPSLLHGDLWGGNAGMLADGTPVVFDPAVHHGDRECDLAMAALFGGFGAAFFQAYDATWPLEPGWQRRRAFYQLYHVLNHALLFGGAYLDDARRRIAALTG